MLIILKSKKGGILIPKVKTWHGLCRFSAAILVSHVGTGQYAVPTQRSINLREIFR